jgi:hypothetical protein
MCKGAQGVVLFSASQRFLFSKINFEKALGIRNLE